MDTETKSSLNSKSCLYMIITTHSSDEPFLFGEIFLAESNVFCTFAAIFEREKEAINKR